MAPGMGDCCLMALFPGQCFDNPRHSRSLWHGDPWVQCSSCAGAALLSLFQGGEVGAQVPRLMSLVRRVAGFELRSLN